MEPVNNPIDGDLFAHLHSADDVQTTAAVGHPRTSAIRKCVHPPSAVPDYQGLPTNDARSQVCLEWRNMDIITTPRMYNVATSKVYTPTAAQYQAFDYTLLMPNGCRVLAIPFISNPTANNELTQDLANVMVQDNYNFTNWNQDANKYRMAYKSSTFYLNATAFNNTGMVVGSQFNPNIMFAGTIQTFANTMPSHFYEFVRDGLKAGRYTVTPASKATEEALAGWESIPHYHRAEIVRVANLNPNEIVNLDPDTAIQVISFGRVLTNQSIGVPSSSNILAQSMRSLGCKAQEGMFSVQRLNTVSPRWLTSANTINTLQALPGLYQCFTYSIDAAMIGHFVALSYNTADGTAAGSIPVLLDTLWSPDMTWSWVRFSGLSLNTAANNSTQLLIRKVYSGVEVQPSMSSAWAGMVRLGPKPDIEAMQATMDAFYELKDVFPARYNFWGTLGSIAASGLATFGSSLLNKLLNEISGKTKPKDKPSKTAMPAAKPGAAKLGKHAKKEDKRIDALTAKIDKLATVVGTIQRARPQRTMPGVIPKRASTRPAKRRAKRDNVPA